MKGARGTQQNSEGEPSKNKEKPIAYSIGLHLSSIWAPFEFHWTPFELQSKSLEMRFQGETQGTIRSGPLALRRADRLHEKGEIMVFLPFFISEGPGGLKSIKNQTHPRTPNALPLSRRPEWMNAMSEWHVMNEWHVMTERHVISGWRVIRGWVNGMWSMD